MSRFYSYIQSAQIAIDSYKNGTPLTHHLKLFFQTDKKFGSRDRKSIASICYHYFRCKHILAEELSFEQKIIHATFLCESMESELLKALSPELNELIAFPVEEKLDYLEIDIKNAFAFQEELSTDIDKHLFSQSMYMQPDLFLRIRPGKNKKVCDALNNAAIEYRLIGESTIVLENGVSVENILQINKDVVVQDLNSQKVFDFFVKERSAEKAEQVWDCCAASGGKSILLYDQCGSNTKLTVSDIRESILTNLQLRLKDAGINIQKKFVQDLTLKSGLMMEEKFSVVICDVPCSGSGTWSRTPEQYASFDQSQIQQFADQQQKIVINSIQHLAKNGWFIYITCSVFKAENEDMVEFITNHFSCQLLEMKYLKGYSNKADTLFVAYFKN